MLCINTDLYYQRKLVGVHTYFISNLNVFTFGKIWVQRRRFEVNLIVTWDGSNGLISDRPGLTIGAIDTIDRLAFFSEASDSERLVTSLCNKNVYIDFI